MNFEHISQAEAANEPTRLARRLANHDRLYYVEVTPGAPAQADRQLEGCKADGVPPSHCSFVTFANS